MLRGTRSQYVRRAHYFSLVPTVAILIGLPICMVLASQGWIKILAVVSLLLGSLGAFLLVIFATNKQWQKAQAELGRKNNQHAHATYFPTGYYPSPRDYPTIRSFLKRLFQRKSN